MYAPGDGLLVRTITGLGKSCFYLTKSAEFNTLFTVFIMLPKELRTITAAL